jgi:peptidoglycan hydrolase CwlO-like protein
MRECQNCIELKKKFKRLQDKIEELEATIDGMNKDIADMCEKYP